MQSRYRPYLSALVTIIAMLGIPAAICQADWPSDVKGAWAVERAESYLDGEFDGTDPAARDNLLLLIGGRMLYACDRGAANNKRFSETPEIIDKGIEFTNELSSNGALLVRHATGQAHMIVHQREGSSPRRLDITVRYTHRKFPRESIKVTLVEVDQPQAKQRVKSMVERGRYSSRAADRDIVKETVSSWIEAP